MEFKRSQNELIVFLQGEIDHCAVQPLRMRIESMILSAKPKTLIIDFARVSFMDSSGIGLLIGRYKTMKARDGIIIARGMSDAIEQIFRMAGLHRIITIEHAKEEGENE